MAKFYQAIMTNSGAELLTEALAGTAKIEFSTLVTGDGIYTEDERSVISLQERTALKHQIQSVGFSAIKIASQTSVKLTAAINNEQLKEGYYVREVGLYARNVLDESAEPVLYSVAIAEMADYMPPYNGMIPTMIIQEYFATVDNAANVTLVAGSGAYALAEDFEKHNNNDIIHITEKERDTWNASLKKSKDYTDKKIADLINGAPTTLDTLKEIADAMEEHREVVDALEKAIGTKASSDEVDLKLDKTGDSKDNTVTFVSNDIKTPSEWSDFDLIACGETHQSFWEKVSTIAKNLRWLYKMIGKTDISSIGDGTLTGAVASLNSNSIKVKYFSKNNIPITTKSSSGAYYGVFATTTELGIDGKIVGASINCWNGASASFTPYVQGNNVSFFSDVPFTLETCNVYILYLDNFSQ